MVIIGIDPHPKNHTAVVLDQNGKQLNYVTVGNCPKGLVTLKEWLQAHTVTVCAVEGANNSFARRCVIAKGTADGAKDDSDEASEEQQQEHVFAAPQHENNQYRERFVGKSTEVLTFGCGCHALS